VSATGTPARTLTGRLVSASGRGSVDGITVWFAYRPVEGAPETLVVLSDARGGFAFDLPAAALRSAEVGAVLEGVDPVDPDILYLRSKDALEPTGDRLYRSDDGAATWTPVLDSTDERLLRWVDESGVAVIVSDNLAVEQSTQLPREMHARGPAMPLHELCLFKLGIHLGELWYLSELARWLRAHHRSRFFMTAPPLRLPGAVGSPATPVATV